LALSQLRRLVAPPPRVQRSLSVPHLHLASAPALSQRHLPSVSRSVSKLRPHRSAERRPPGCRLCLALRRRLLRRYSEQRLRISRSVCRSRHSNRNQRPMHSLRKARHQLSVDSVRRQPRSLRPPPRRVSAVLLLPLRPSTRQLHFQRERRNSQRAEQAVGQAQQDDGDDSTADAPAMRA
jgi:hypothetical protein